MGMLVLYGISLATALVGCSFDFRDWLKERRARRTELRGVWMVVVRLPPSEAPPAEFLPADDDDEGLFTPPCPTGDA